MAQESLQKKLPQVTLVGRLGNFGSRKECECPKRETQKAEKVAIEIHFV